MARVTCTPALLIMSGGDMGLQQVAHIVNKVNVKCNELRVCDDNEIINILTWCQLSSRVVSTVNVQWTLCLLWSKYHLQAWCGVVCRVDSWGPLSLEHQYIYPCVWCLLPQGYRCVLLLLYQQ